jgi:hypothetical protein
MKIFFFLFFSFAVCSDFVITMDNLTNSYDRVKRSYFKYEKDKSFWPQFRDSHSHLNDFLVQTYETDPINLFRKLEMSQNFQLCFIVIGCIQLTLNQLFCSHLWKEHLSAKIVHKKVGEKFFERTRYFMRMIVRREDWDVGKEILRILLSLQKKFLPRLSFESEIKLVERRLKGYKFLHDRFDPSDSDAILESLIHLNSMALVFNKNYFHINLLNRKFIKLFKIHQFHFLSYRKKLPWDPSKLDQKFLYFILFPISIRNFFDYMKTPHELSLKHLTGLDVFQKIFKIYKETIKPKSFSINDAMVNSSSEFIKFVRESIDSNIFDLDERELWYLKGVLCLIPIYIY